MDGGSTCLPAVRENQPNNNEVDLYPSIMTTPEGFVWVSYIQQNGPFYNVTVARSTNGGNSFTLWVNASQPKVPTDGILDSHLVSDSGGRLYLLVETYSFSSAFHYVLNYTWSDDGINWSVPTPITSATTWALNAAIAVDASNHVHMAWEDFRTSYSLGVPTVWYTQSTDRGLTWSPQLPLETTAISNNPQYVHLATYGSNVMDVWGSTGAGNGMTYAVSGDGGATWYDAKNAVIGYAVMQPTVSVDENGTFWTVVTDSTGTYRRVGNLAWNSPPTTPANITALQNQLVALQNQVTALQNSQAANDAATAAALANLRSQISSLWNQLNQTRQDLSNARAEQATQTMSYVNMALAIIILLLVAMLLLQMRRPRNPVQVMSPEPPGRVVTQPRTPEDELSANG